MTAQRFFVCKHCGNIIAFVHASGAPVTCCGDVMTEIVPNSTDAAQEKHVPVIEVNGNVVTVTVGSTLHPMTDEHYIQWSPASPVLSLPCQREGDREAVVGFTPSRRMSF
jgi:desulfoferrodoxin